MNYLRTQLKKERERNQQNLDQLNELFALEDDVLKQSKQQAEIQKIKDEEFGSKLEELQ